MEASVPFHDRSRVFIRVCGDPRVMLQKLSSPRLAMWLLGADALVAAFYMAAFALWDLRLISYALGFGALAGLAVAGLVLLRRDDAGKVPAVALGVGSIAWSLTGLALLGELDAESGLILDMLGVTLLALATIAVVGLHVACGRRAWVDA